MLPGKIGTYNQVFYTNIFYKNNNFNTLELY